MALDSTQQRDTYKLMVGMFNASPGIDVFSAVANIIIAGATVDQLYEALAVSPIFMSQDFDYGSGATESQFATQFVNTLVGDTVSQENKDALADAIAGVLDADILTRGQAMKLVIDLLDDIDPSDPAWGAAAQQFDNKIDVAINFTEVQNGTATSLAGLQQTLAGVTDDPATVDAAISGNQGAAGGTFVLTDKIDNLSGTSGNDTFIGDNNTASAADQVNGGAGTDTLKLFDTVGLPTITGVESLYLNSPYDGAAGTLGIDISGNSEITSLTIDNNVTEDDDAYKIASSQSVTLKSITEGAAGEDLNISSSSSVTSITLTVDAVGTSSTDVDVDIVGSGVTTLNLTGSGNASVFSLVNTGTALKTLNVAGDKAVTIDADFDSNAGAITSNLTTITVTNTGGVSVVTDAGAAKDITFTGGSGNDAVFFGTEFTPTDSADGGAGTDTIGIADGGDLTTDSGARATNFETLDIRGGTGSYNASKLAGLTLVKVGAALSAATTVTNMTTTTNVEIAADTGPYVLTLQQKDAGAGSPDDSLTITLNKSSAITMDATSQIVVDDIETLNVNSTSSGTSITHTIDFLKTDESSKIVLNASTAKLTINELDSAAAVLVDGSTSAKGITLVVGAHAFTSPSGVQFNGGAASDTITLTAVTDFSSTATAATVILQGGGAGDVINVAGDTGAGTGNTEGEIYTFKFAAGDSVSKAGAANGFDSSVSDTIAGFEANAAFVAATAGAGSKFTLDTEVSATTVKFSTTAVTFGTTAVDTAGDFFVFDTAAGGIAFVYQDTDGDKLIESGEFAIQLVGNASTFTATEFTVASGNLVYTSIA